ncbi:MAG: hypothetical protein K8I03_15880 [Ignavibacteria bacterium]|nr:hypothetical protein [Ignavibacteria bacterium]
MKWINSSDLKFWAIKQNRNCQQYLPLLIRWLITETGNNFITKKIFPAGDAIHTAGWDGILETNASSEYIPHGMSFWEFGCAERIKHQAENNYTKRTSELLSTVERKKATFVFVTPRIWNYKQKDKWENEKNLEKRWKQIIVYDGRDLEEWLENAPVTSSKFARKILGNYPDKVQPLEDFWEEWSICQKYKINENLVLAGRKNELENISKWLSGPPSRYILKALTREEALAFLCACIMHSNEKANYLSKSLIIKDNYEFTELIKEHTGKILINYFGNFDAVDLAINRGNHVFIPLAPDATSIEANNNLQTLGLEDLVTELKKMGLSDADARHFSKDSGRSLSVLRRLLFGKMKQPEWSKRQNVRDIIPLLFIQRWDDSQTRSDKRKIKSKFDDKKVIKKISGLKYKNFLAKITEYKNIEDPPIYQIGFKWRLVSPIDAWYAIAPYVTFQHLDIFKKIVIDVLVEPDPEFELDENERYRAELLGKYRKYSEWIREGILQSLVLIAIYGDRISSLQGNHQEWVDNIILELIDNIDDKKWFSLSNILPQIAEASPVSFLNSIENSLRTNEKSIMILFREGTDAFFSRCNHAGLLWALESLAWKSEYIIQVTRILGQLCKLAPASRWGNTPISTLRGIFLAWLPYTTANLSERFSALDVLIKENEDVAVKLLLNLLPKPHDIGHPTYKARWRWFSELNEARVTIKEMHDTYSGVLDRLLKIAGNNGLLLAKILPSFDDLSLQKDRDKLFIHLKSILGQVTSGKKELWNKLREMISRHKTYKDAAWILPAIEIKRLEELYEEFRLDDTIQNYKWLFDDHYPNLLDGDRKNYKEYEKKIEDARIDAIGKIIMAENEDKIIELATTVKFPYFLGLSLAKTNFVNSELEAKIISKSIDNENLINFSRGYYDGMRKKQVNWVFERMTYFQNNESKQEIIVNFLTSLDFGRPTWDLVEQFSKEIQNLYWAKCYVWFHEIQGKDKKFAIRNLLQVNRFITLIDTVSYHSENIPSELIADILEKAITIKSNDENKNRIDPHNVAELFKVLDKNGYNNTPNLVKLEWFYIEILSDDFWGRPPKLLHNDMSLNAKSFVDVIKMIFKPKDDEELQKEETKGLTENQIINRYRAAYDLLSSFKTIPGKDKNGKIDYQTLLSWVKNVIKLSKKSKREYHGKYFIGELFAKGIEKDSLPLEEICRVIEELNSQELKQGFQIANSNRRGLTTRNPFEGGVQEKSLSEHYYQLAKEIELKYPFTSKMYKDIAKTYELDAKREDDRATEEELEY